MKFPVPPVVDLIGRHDVHGSGDTAGRPLAHGFPIRAATHGFLP